MRSILFPTPTWTKYAVLFVLFCAMAGAYAAMAWTAYAAMAWTRTSWFGFVFAPLSVYWAVLAWNRMERYS